VTPVAQPLNHYAGVIGVEEARLGFPRLAVCSANLPGEIAIDVENQLDDGDPRRGSSARRSKPRTTSRSRPPMRR